MWCILVAKWKEVTLKKEFWYNCNFFFYVIIWLFPFFDHVTKCCNIFKSKNFFWNFIFPWDSLDQLWYITYDKLWIRTKKKLDFYHLPVHCASVIDALGREKADFSQGGWLLIGPFKPGPPISCSDGRKITNNSRIAVSLLVSESIILAVTGVLYIVIRSNWK